MKKQISSLLAFGTLFLINPFSVFAGSPTPIGTDTLCPKDSFQHLCELGSANNVLGKVINIIFVLAVVIALFYLIYGGFKWLTSGGDSKQVDAARQHIIAAIIGLIIIFLSYFILNFVVKLFVPDFNITSFTVPSL